MDDSLCCVYLGDRTLILHFQSSVVYLIPCASVIMEAEPVNQDRPDEPDEPDEPVVLSLPSEPPSVPSFLNDLLTSTVRKNYSVGLRNQHNILVSSLEFYRNDEFTTHPFVITCRLGVFGSDTLEGAWHKFYESFISARSCKHCSSVQSGTHCWTEDFTCETCQIRFLLQVPEQCAVCLHNTQTIYRVSCGHNICRSCMSRWKGGTCPTCRKPFVIMSGWNEPVFHDCECGVFHGDEDD
jgi:hypothetical protein